jgi:tetratricopeptide (TPR) repeat protein
LLSAKMTIAAAEALTRSLSKDADNPDAWHLLAECDRANELAAKGVVACRRAIELEPRNPDHHLLLGLLLGGVRQWEEAETCLRFATTLPDAPPQTWKTLALMLWEQAKWVEARDVLEEASDVLNDRSDFHALYADVLDRLGLLQEARESIARAGELAPTDPYIKKLIARLANASGPAPTIERN